MYKRSQKTLVTEEISLSQIDIVSETINKLEYLKDNVRKESIEWWWLDQGDAPVIEVHEAIIKDREIVTFMRRKVSVKIAINIILENLRASLKMTEKERTKLIRVVENDLVNLTELIQNIKEAHSIVEDLHNILSYLEKQESTEEIAKLKKIARGTIDWIREIFYSNPAEWTNKSQLFKNVIKKLKHDIK